MQAELLTDTELYILVRNTELSYERKKIINKEFKNRNFSIERIDKLAMAYENVLGESKNNLTVLEKFLIILVPFFPVIHAIIANRHISRGQQRKWKQHWTYVTIGYAVWTLLIVLFAKFYLFKSH